MKVVVLVDNNTLIDRYFVGEPGFSVYIEDGRHKILFDTGYSDVLVRNAKSMDISLDAIDTIVFSHGHNDHTGGMRYLKSLKQNIKVISHPGAYADKRYEGLDVSMPVKTLPDNFEIIRTTEPFRISDHLTFLGEIPRTVGPLRYLEKDPLLDDSALVYENGEGIFIITGCSHSGIDNIVEYAVNITGKKHIIGILGGFHMQSDREYDERIVAYLSKLDIEIIYPCHCTDLEAKMILGGSCRICEIGVSSVIKL